MELEMAAFGICDERTICEVASTPVREPSTASKSCTAIGSDQSVYTHSKQLHFYKLPESLGATKTVNYH